MDPTQLKEQFFYFLKSQGLKLTWERQTIFEAVLRWTGHFSPEEMVVHFEQAHNSGHRISRATIYRTLKVLEEAKILKSFHAKEEYKTYELTSEHHDHMVCNNCGQIIEFFDERLEKLQNMICKELGFYAQKHSMIIQGLCKECQISNAKTPPML